MNIPVAVRIIIGLALVIVAHQVLLKRPQTSELSNVTKKKQQNQRKPPIVIKVYELISVLHVNVLEISAEKKTKKNSLICWNTE